MIRWGIGNGKCLGKNMADLMLKMGTVAVVGRYAIKPYKGEDVELERKGAAIAGDGRVLLERI